MPCGCFGGGAGVGKKDGDKYGPKGKGNDESKVQLITTKPPVIEPIPEPVKSVVQTSAAPPPKGGSSPTDGTRRAGEDDPDKANRRRDVVASYYSDECELLTYKTTSSRPTSQVGDGEGSPPAATSSPVPSSPASSRSAASTRADLAEKRREFFKPLVEDKQELQWTGKENKQPLIGYDLAHPHAQPLLEKHERQMENFKEPTVKDVVHKFEHMPDPKLETEVILGKNSSTVTVLQSKEMRIGHKPVEIITHKDDVVLTPAQEIQEKQLVNKASVHQQLLGGIGNLRPTPAPAPKPREMPEMTITVPDEPHNDDCIIQSAITPEVEFTSPIPAKPPREPSLSEARNNVAEYVPVVTEQETFVERPRSVVEEPKPVVEEPKPVVEEPKPVVEETKLVVEETKPVVEESKPVVEEPKPVVEEPKPIVEEPKPIVEEPKPVVEEPKPVVEEPKPVVAEPISVVEVPKSVVEEHISVVEESISVEESNFDAESRPIITDVKPIVEPEHIIAGHEFENVIDNVQQSMEHVEKTEPFFVSEQFSGSETDITNSKSFKESLSNTFEISQAQDSKAIDANDSTSVTEPMFASEDVSLVTQETDLISVLEENKKNILSSQSEQMSVDNQPKNTTEIINSDLSFIIESESVSNKDQEMFPQIKNSVDDSPQVKLDHDGTSEEERISIINKEDPMALDLAMETLADIRDSKHSVEVESTDDGTMHTQITKSMETDEDGNTIMHTRTIKTTTIGSTEPMSDMMENFADILSKPSESMDVNSSDDGTMHTQTTKSTVSDDAGNTITHTRTIKSTTISSSDPMSEILSTEAFMTEPLFDTKSAFISESTSVVEDSSHLNDDQHQQSDIQSTIQSSLSPMTQVGSSPTPTSTPSPRNSIHSSPPASPDIPRAQNIDKVEFQHEQEPLVPQLKQEAQDHLNHEENATHNSVLNKDAKTNGPPSPSIDSRNPHTCNEADITAPTSQEDDGLGSEIDDALDSIDCLSEEANSHSLQHHHQSVPAPPPPSSAS